MSKKNFAVFRATDKYCEPFYADDAMREGFEHQLIFFDQYKSNGKMHVAELLGESDLTISDPDKKKRKALSGIETPWALWCESYIGSPDDIIRAHPITIVDKKPSDSERHITGSVRARRQGKRACIYEKTLKGWRYYLWLKATDEDAIRIISISKDKFAIPSHPLMFALLAMFAGKPEHMPRKLLLKPHSERTPEEREEADKFLNSILETKTETSYNGNGKPQKEEKHLAMISDNPKVRAEAEISHTLFSNDLIFQEGALAMYIKRAFGAEGLRHLLGLVVGLEENFRRGNFVWKLSEHLERLGYKRKKHGDFPRKAKRTATEIVKIFTSLFITAREKKPNGKEIIRGKRLFSVEGFTFTAFERAIINEELELRATEFWYKNAIDPQDGKSPQYSKLLRKVVKESHKTHGLTIYLAPLFTIFWRLEPQGKKIRIRKLMEWCDLDTKGHNRMRDIEKLVKELEYMKKQGHLGDWTNGDEDEIPMDSKQPLEYVLDLTPPGWLREELKAIADKREQYIPLPPPEQKIKLLTPDEFKGIFKDSKLSQKQFAEKVGISRTTVNFVLQGKAKIGAEISRKIRQNFNA